MSLVAVIVLLVLVPLTIWAWRRAPGRAAIAEFSAIWQNGSWGKQIIADFYGLEAILALWMLSHAMAHETLGLAIGCILAMPIFGSMAAAAYWLLAMA